MTDPTSVVTPFTPTADELRAFERAWMDPDSADGELTTFRTYRQPSRNRDDDGVGDGSYLLHLPKAYQDEPERRFPVIYWLHGGMSHSHSCAAAVARIDRGMRAGRMPPAIVVAPQALPIGWYVDSKDGARPVEQVLVHDLIPHIDRTYRTIAESRSRTIEGFSMGGYGALHLGFKYPRLFGRLSSIAPSILKDMSLEPAERVDNTFFGDQRYYDAVGPWNLVLANAPEIRRIQKVRLVSGSLDTRLIAVNRELDEVMTELGIDHETFEVDDADHEVPKLIDGLGDDYYRFWHD